VVIVQPEAKLLEVVCAGIAPGRFAGALHRRQEKPHEHADDRDHDQELDKGEAAAGEVFHGAVQASVRHMTG
jgi:hypothetical protein